MNDKGQKLGLVLEGGGVKGAYQVGVLLAIRELGVEFDGVTGTSIGAINGALYLEGGYDKLLDVWKHGFCAHRRRNRIHSQSRFDAGNYKSRQRKEIENDKNARSVLQTVAGVF